MHAPALIFSSQPSQKKKLPGAGTPKELKEAAHSRRGHRTLEHCDYTSFGRACQSVPQRRYIFMGMTNQHRPVAAEPESLADQGAEGRGAQDVHQCKAGPHRPAGSKCKRQMPGWMRAFAAPPSAALEVWNEYLISVQGYRRHKLCRAGGEVRAELHPASGGRPPDWRPEYGNAAGCAESGIQGRQS